MPSYGHLPAELRYDILEYVIKDLSSPLSRPNVDALHLDDWYSPNYKQQELVPTTRYYRENDWEERLLPLLLVNKTFHCDTRHVLDTYVGPQLTPIVNVDCVGFGSAAAPRQLRGILIKWLSLPTGFDLVEELEFHVRFFDHRLASQGAMLSNNRPLPARIPEVTATYFQLGVQSLLRAVATKDLYPLYTRSAHKLTRLRLLKVKLHTEQPADLHWAHGHTPQFADPEAKFMLSLHPYFTAQYMATSFIEDRVMDEDAKLHIDECEIYVDNHVVNRFKKVKDNEGNENVECSEYPYEMTRDPVML